MGVATANSILMVSFAREQLDEGIPAVQAAVQQGQDPGGVEIYIQRNNPYLLQDEQTLLQQDHVR